jgi:regulator of replication initiation timing
MPGQSFQKIVAYCELLESKLTPLLPEMPHLKDESESLGVLVGELKGLSHEQEDLKARLREMTRRRREAERKSQDLRGRIVAQLQGKLGFTNENLIAFGIIPRKTVRRRRVLKPPEEVPSGGVKKNAAPVPPVPSDLDE